MKGTVAAALILAALLAGAAEASSGTLTKKGTVVSYDERSLLIDGKRTSSSQAPSTTRAAPDMWHKLLKTAKDGGLNTIETYVFWNAHEPEPGKERLDQVPQAHQSHDMYALVRISPFIQAEWNHSGLPYWLREIPHNIPRQQQALQRTVVVNSLK
ncbi:hypothetical protein ZWY2020_006938 [Hordeum vulgare]|nr:hypothetical protein ZWY2020_006938 [Hordeum vulgare]